MAGTVVRMDGQLLRQKSHIDLSRDQSRDQSRNNRENNRENNQAGAAS
jgi:hypothetical protein